MRSATVILSFFLSLALGGPAAFADGGLKPPSSSKSKSAEQKTDASIRVDVSMVLAPVNVFDPSGRSVTGLERENFRLLDGKEPRPIQSFSREDQPISVGLVFDCSRSMLDKFTLSREAPAELYKQLSDRDESFLITVSDEPTLRQPLTSDFAALQNALLFTNPHGSTALIDSVYLALTQMKKAHNSRRALVVVSDGGDNNSRYTPRELRKIALEADVQIFAIGLHQSPQTVEEEMGPDLMAGLARASGGIHFPIRNCDEMASVMAKIGVTLHNEYVLGYYPSPNAQSGKYRPITVQVVVPASLPPLRVFARAGYYAPER